MEQIQFTISRMFGAVVCNPEFWCYQYAPIWIAAIFN